MNQFELAKIIDLAGGIDGRKRLQKMVFLLRWAGVPLDFDFIIHFYGPYSFELTNLVSRLTENGLIEENAEPISGTAMRYSYRLSDSARKQVGELERDSRYSGVARTLDNKKALVEKLNTEDIWTLELGSTIAYFLSKQREKVDRELAIRAACEVKNRQPEDEDVKKAIKFLDEIAASRS